MSAEFVDTNVLVCAHDLTDARHDKASALIERLWLSGEGVLSTQVLQELYWIVTKKVPKPLEASKAIDILEDFAKWRVVSPTADDVVDATRLAVRRRLSFWNAMIVQAAIVANATTLWSEDLGEGSEYGSVVVRNPFR